ncbi:MAG: discoidin domain-containing protein [Kiritimatiellaeota bacterium]|nr:discoidin domain-containing protein [Kiritimatiellota bacterium]
MKKTMMMMTAAGALLAVTAAHAQWTGTLLNNLAVTNASGQINVLHDGGGSYNNNQNYTADKAFDKNTSTYYDPSAAFSQGAWVGFEMETPMLITRVRYYGRQTYANRVRGVEVQGANLSDFSDAVTLWTLNPPENWNPQSWNEELILDPVAATSFKFVRCYAPLPLSYGGNFAELEFYGAAPMNAANPPAAPVLAFDGCVNWRMNLIWPGATDTILYEIERKIGHEDVFSPHFSRYHQSGDIHYMDSTFFMYQDTEYRIRAHNNAGASSWVTVTGFARNGATGQWIGTPGTYGGGMTGDKAFDGNVTTYFDAPSGNANNAWTGLDFGSEKEITSIRFVPRRNSTHPNRMDGGWFEVADNPDFINPTGVYTNNGAPSISGVTEVVLAQPVTNRYARYCSPSSGYCNVAAIDFIQPPTPLPSTGLTVASSDITNAFAVLTWDSRDGITSLFSSTLVYRATSPGGPYDLMTPEGLCAEQEWTDTTVATSIRYYYRLTALVNTLSGPIEGEPSPYVSYIPCFWIERDPVTLATIKPGMALLGAGAPYQNNGNLDVHAMFDNKLNTYVDTVATNPAVGVDLAKPYGIVFMRHAARSGSGSVARLNGAELRGSNDPDYTNNFTRLATFAGAVSETLVTQQTVNQEPFRYIFAQRPDANQFHGNINELELYGWDPDIANSIFRAPPSVTLSFQPGGIQLDWEQGTQQDSYRIERSTDGVTWTSVGDTSATPFIDGTPLIGQRAFYRVVAVQTAPPAEAYSDPYPIIAYTSGNGTGLTANYFTSFTLAYNPAEAWAGTFTEGPIDFNIAAAGTPIRPDVPGSDLNVRIAWTGKLIVPFESDYTFYLTRDDGVALRIDGDFVINRWTATTTPEQGTVHLTAGEHPLRLDYFQAGGGKTLKLEWGGAVDRAVIPVLQLLPDPLPTGEGVFMQTGDWSGRTFGGNRLGFHTLNPDGSLTVAHSDSDMSGTTERYHYVWQTIRGDFVFESLVDIDIDPARATGKGMLMVRNGLSAGSPFFAAAMIATNSVGKFNVTQRLAQGANITDASAWIPPYLNPAYLRIKRVGDVFEFAYRDPASPPSAWVTYHTFEDTTGIFNTDLFAGVAVCGNDTSPQMFQTVDFSEIKLRRLIIYTLLMIK